nr:RNA-directed DNA polymerase, eukaryota, reverse transcriptase zinc-binding domain protein [Tanacetum cinerariifolium]
NSNRDAKAQLKLELEVVDSCINNGNGTVKNIKRRGKIVNKLQDIDKLHALETTQKAKVKWAVEGDENSNFFHELEVVDSCINNGNGTVKDIKRRGKIVNKLQDIDKLHALETAQKAKVKWAVEGDENFSFFHDQKRDLEGEVTNDEIKKAVWDCGTDKAPGPDGFTFGFYRKFWYLIDNDVCDAVRFFFKSDNIPNGCNSSFIALIPKIPDANMVKD